MLGLNVFTLNHRLSSRMNTPDLYIVLQQPRANAKRITFIICRIGLVPNSQSVLFYRVNLHRTNSVTRVYQSAVVRFKLIVMDEESILKCRCFHFRIKSFSAGLQFAARLHSEFPLN